MTRLRESQLVGCLASRVMGWEVGESRHFPGKYPFFATRHSYVIHGSGYGTVWNPLVRIEDALACADKFQRDYQVRMVISRRPDGKVCVCMIDANSDAPAGKFHNEVPPSDTDALLGVFTGVNLAEVICLAIEIALGSGGCEA
jgi:hypothetical protein